MSINGNSVFGSIDISTESYIVGRIIEQGVPMFFMGTYDQRSNPQFSFRCVTDLASFYTWRINSDNLRKTSITMSYKNESKYIGGIYDERNGSYRSRLTSDINEYTGLSREVFWSLSPKQQNVPLDSLYSSVWYNIKSYDGKALLLSVQMPREHRAGIPPYDSFGKYMLMDIDVAFIPKKHLSIWNKNRCTITPNVSTSIEIYISWIEHAYNRGTRLQDYNQVACNSTLTSDSKNCLFTDDTCNNNTGGVYCKHDETCGKCYGNCKDGGFCIMDNDESPNRWYCLDNSKKHQGRWSRDLDDWRFLLLIIVSVVVLVLILYLFSKKKC